EQTLPRAGMATPSPDVAFESFVFLDLETTTLNRRRVRTAEISLSAVHRCSLEEPESDPESDSEWEFPLPPRIVDKLTLCLDPQKPFAHRAMELTGLSNRSLKENGKPGFDQALVQAVCGFLMRQPGPVCLVAHNGYNFDFPLLRRELDRLGEDLPSNLWCLDTLPALQELEGHARMSYSLSNLYKYYYGQEPDPDRAHSAEGDVETLLMVFLYRAEGLMAWAEENAPRWNEIEPM
uniref:exodeoxyribonuclease III n=1 Tax=Sphenodon punctatus TaxID=8508 RepID=A0A8D0HFV0_SPHPU